MVRTIPSVIHATSVYIDISASAQANGNNPLPSSFPIVTPTIIGTTSSTIFEPIFTAKYTVDTEGIIEVGEILVNIETYNGANAHSKYQISGDGGNTFVDLTTSIGPGSGIATTGRGKWVDNIEVGSDKLQLRVLGLSTNGLPATIAEGGIPPKFITITLVKKPPRPF